MIGIKEIIKPIGSQSFIAGIGVAALVYILGPQLKQTLRPVAVKGVQGIMAIGSNTMKAFSDNKNKHIEADTSMPENKVDLENESSRSLLQELKEEREASNKILSELLTSISGLKEELSSLRSNNIQPS